MSRCVNARNRPGRSAGTQVPVLKYHAPSSSGCATGSCEWPNTTNGARTRRAIADGTRREYVESVSTVPLLIIDDFGMRKLPHTAAEDLLEVIMRRYERASTVLTSNRPVDDWGKLLGDTAAVTALLDRLLHHAHVLKCGPRSWRTKVHTDLRPDEGAK